jgi:hypothetical protein
MHRFDPDYLPETSGIVDGFLLNAEGEADGLMLTDGTEVHFPPHMGGALLEAVTPGSAVRVRGARPRGVAMIAAVALVLPEGTPIVDNGPPEEGAARKAARKQARATRIGMNAEGILKRVLHGPKGEVRGLLLEDGRAGRFPPHAAAALTALLEPGSTVLLRGEGLTTRYGTVITVGAIGSSPSNMRRLDQKPAKAKPEKPHKLRKQDRSTIASDDAPTI